MHPPHSGAAPSVHSTGEPLRRPARVESRSGFAGPGSGRKSVMTNHGRLGCVALVLAAVAGVSACGSGPATSALIKPVAATAQPEAPSLQGIGPGEPDDDAPG